MLEHPIDDHPRSERVVGRSDPIGQGPTTTGGTPRSRRCDDRRRRSHHREESRLHRLAWARGIAASQEVGDRSNGPGLGHCQGFGLFLTGQRHLIGRTSIAVRVDVPEKRQQRVVIALGDGIDLMVVAAGAIHGEPQKDLARGGDQIIKLIVEREFPVGRIVVPNPQTVITGGDQTLGTAVGQFVAGQLFPNEPVVGFVGVEGADDVVAVPPSMGLGLVGLVAVGLGEAHQIKPMPSPLLAVMGRLEQAIDQMLPGLRRRIVNEGLDLIGRRRQPREVVGHPPDQRPTAGCFGKRQPLVTQPLSNECVDGIRRGFAPIGSEVNRGHLLSYCLKGPMRAPGIP